jgi:putative addiction module killer protein
MGYKNDHPIEIRQTRVFARWFGGLCDVRARALIQARIDRLAVGHFGDVEAVGEGVCEMRVDFGPGYRVYFVRKGVTVVVLLAGGDKGSQDRDIATAIGLARDL